MIANEQNSSTRYGMEKVGSEYNAAGIYSNSYRGTRDIAVCFKLLATKYKIRILTQYT
jgi:hypothetical protein